MSFQFSLRDAFDLAESKVGVPGWVPYKWQAADGGCIVTGDKPYGVYTKGPRKGRPRHQHKNATDARTVVISTAELVAVAEAYELSSGACWNCQGTGQVWRGWPEREGHKYGPCKRCGAAGERNKA